MLRKLKLILRYAATKRNGLTITEVVVASGLLIVAMVPILQALTTANLNTAGMERKTRSLVLAQAKLDEIKAKSIYHYTNGGASFAQDDLSLGGSYLCNIADDSNDTLKTIAVSVGYDYNVDSALAADEIEVTLTTLIARRWTD
jgi:Tfp pilus assembly protein PilV